MQRRVDAKNKIKSSETARLSEVIFSLSLGCAEQESSGARIRRIFVVNDLFVCSVVKLIRVTCNRNKSSLFGRFLMKQLENYIFKMFAFLECRVVGE